MAKKIFKEKQSFKNKFLTTLLIVLGLLVIIRVINEFLNPSDQFASVMIAAFIALSVIGGWLWYLYNLRLKVTVSEEDISFKMKPWQSEKRRISWNDVSCCEIIQTPELAQWQGGNITFNHERRYTVSGRNGLHLVTKDGTEYFVGSSRLHELEKAVKKVFDCGCQKSNRDLAV